MEQRPTELTGSGERMPPDDLGITLLQASMAAEGRDTLVRYWPLRDRPCRPHVGFVLASARVHERDVLWLTGKSGYVSCSHVELIPEAPEQAVTT